MKKMSCVRKGILLLCVGAFCALTMGSTYPQDQLHRADDPYAWQHITSSEEENAAYMATLGPGTPVGGGITLYRGDTCDCPLPDEDTYIDVSYEVEGMEPFEISIIPGMTIHEEFPSEQDTDAGAEKYLRMKLRNLYGELPSYTYTIQFPDNW